MKVVLAGAKDCAEVISEVKKHLNDIGVDVILCKEENFIFEAARKLAKDEAKKVVFFSQTGLDVWAKAGKTPGLCAAACHNPLKAEEIRKEKEINALCVGIKINKLKYIISIIDVWLITDL